MENTKPDRKKSEKVEDTRKKSEKAVEPVAPVVSPAAVPPTAVSSFILPCVGLLS